MSHHHAPSRGGYGVGLSLRAFAVSTSLLLAACSQVPTPQPSLEELAQTQYRSLPEEPFPIAAVSGTRIKPQYVRQLVAYETHYEPGTIVVDPTEHHLYLVMPDGRAMRYGIGVGREGFGWTGTATIARKAQWPKWTPPTEMIAREPRLEPYRHGMAPGLDNPLGARALYLFQNGKDTLYRLHGTSEVSSIGRNVSSGCIRLLNHDIIDLYRRTPVGSKVVVLQAANTIAHQSSTDASALHGDRNDS